MGVGQCNMGSRVATVNRGIIGSQAGLTHNGGGGSEALGCNCAGRECSRSGGLSFSLDPVLATVYKLGVTNQPCPLGSYLLDVHGCVQ